MKTIFVLFPLLFFGIFLPTTARAYTPVVTSFNAPTSLESGQIANLGWNITGGGHSLIVFCTQGIELFYSTTNQPFPCDTRISVSPYASDGISIIVANESGNQRVVTARIIPKDGNKIDYDAGAKEAVIYVNPDHQPILGFFSSATTTTVSGVPVVFTWTTRYLGGVNMKIDCNDSIYATSSSLNISGILPCGQIIFPNDLPGSGSVSILFNNQANNSLPLNVTLIPAMAPGVYDGTNPQTINLTVAPDAQQPLSVSFGASRTKIYSGDSVSFNWSIKNGAGANLKIACSPYLQFFGPVATTTPIPCDVYGWANPFGAAGSTSVTFINSSIGSQNATIAIFPMLKNGTYAGYYTKSIQVSVEPLPSSASGLQQSVINSPAFSGGNGTTTSSTKKPAAKAGAGTESLDISTFTGAYVLPGCATDYYGYSLTSGLPCSDGNFADPSYVMPPVSGVSSKPLLVPGCSGTYGFSIFNGQSCSGKQPAYTPLTVGAGKYLGGWKGWDNPSSTTAKIAKPYFSKPLDIGSRGNDVIQLQAFLARDPNLYPEGYITGYFGLNTARAVGRLQLRYGLVKSEDDTPYGFVGPATRALLNSLQ